MDETSRPAKERRTTQRQKLSRRGLLKRVKSKLHHFLRRQLGIDLVRFRTPVAEISVIDRRRRDLLVKLKIDVLLDVGANSGQYASAVRAVGFGGRIVSFEPIDVAFKKLDEKHAGDPLWDVHAFGLGARATTATINVAGNNAESSSLLKMVPRLLEEAPSAAYVAEETIRIETLDSLSGKVFRPNDRLWLKIDTQGYEFPVLEGATETLKQVMALEVELSLVSLYENQPLLREALGRLEAMGFQLIGVEEVFCDSSGLRTLQLNGLFERAPR